NVTSLSYEFYFVYLRKENSYMGTIIFIAIVILVLSMIPAPSRYLSKKPRTHTSRSSKTLPWLNSRHRRKRY
ncbi:MAG: hypothetical protein NC453_18915, partial [Muribaculum sp.]|nr:hypothetical protein [Muribaculum sp.]